MANGEINLTNGDDVFVYTGNDNARIYGLSGDDRITLKAEGTVRGDQGNDTLINESGSKWATVWYWGSPGAIHVNLAEGFAEDGYGTRDTLVGFQQIHGNFRSGSRFIGDEKDNQLWVRLDTGRTGTGSANGGAGQDQLVIGDHREPVNYVVRADGSGGYLTQGQFTLEFDSFETLSIWDDDRRTFISKTPQELIDFTKVGYQTLLPTDLSTGWRPSQLKNGNTLTYSFMLTTPVYGGHEGGTGFQTPTAAYGTAARSILTKLSTLTGLKFEEVAETDGSYGQIRFGANQQSNTRGYAFIPGQATDEKAGDVWLDIETLALLEEGQEGWQVLLHEIGHALGLVHPSKVSSANATALLDGWNNNVFTVMSENVATKGMWQSWFGPLDMQALRHLYKAGTSGEAAGNTLHQMTDQTGKSIKTLVDSGGYDSVDLSSLSYGAYFTLEPGKTSSVGINALGFAANGNILIDDFTVIEELVGTAFDDVLIGNTANNAFYPVAGNDIIRGGEGMDTVVLNAPRSAYYIFLSEYTERVQIESRDGTSGTMDIDSIETLLFSDAKISLTARSSGITAKVIQVDAKLIEAAQLAGALYGPSAARNPDTIAGIVDQLDKGMSLSEVALVEASSTRFTSLAGTSNQDFVRFVYKNVAGAEPPAVDLNTFTGYLDQGVHTRGSLGEFAATHPANLASINLTGIQIGGIDLGL